MEKDKNKKKTLTISGSFNKKISPSSYVKTTKKSYFVEKKKSSKITSRPKLWSKQPKDGGKLGKRKFNRKFVEQQATKRFIHSEKKETDKAKEKSVNKNKNYQT